MGRRHEVIHHDQTANVQNAFRKDVCSLGNVMEELGNTFQEESEDLLVLDSKEIADPSAVEAVKKAQKIGQQQFQTFTKESLVERTKPIDDTILRNRLKLFVGSRTKAASTEKQQLTLMKSDVELFSRLYITCQTRDGNLEDFFQQENQAWPPALSDGGRLRLGSKSDILTCLDDLSPSQTKTHDATCIVLDGAAIKQMMKPAAAKTFDEYAQQVFIPYISSQLRSVSRLDLVWDDSLKGTARAKRGKDVRRHVVGKAALPGNWQNFLRIDSNKRELFSFLSKIRRSVRKTSKLSSPLGRGCSAHSYCRMSTPCGHTALKKLIVVRTVDTDVVVLAVFAITYLPAEYLWLAFGTNKSFRYMAANQIAVSLGPEMSCALPIFHALTCCDTVSSFAGHGKKTAWSTTKVTAGTDRCTIDARIWVKGDPR